MWEIRFCPVCGKQRDGEAAFCAGCGRRYELSSSKPRRDLEAIGRRIGIIVGRLILLVVVFWVIVKVFDILPDILPRTETIGLDGTAVTETIEGPGAHFNSLGSGWSYRASEPTDEPVVCSLNRNGVTIRIRDTGYHVLGSTICASLASQR